MSTRAERPVDDGDAAGVTAVVEDHGSGRADGAALSVFKPKVQVPRWISAMELTGMSAIGSDGASEHH